MPFYISRCENLPRGTKILASSALDHLQYSIYNGKHIKGLIDIAYFRKSIVIKILTLVWARCHFREVLV